MTHTISKWLTFIGFGLTIYLLWDGWRPIVGLLGGLTFISMSVAAYTE